MVLHLRLTFRESVGLQSKILTLTAIGAAVLVDFNL